MASIRMTAATPLDRLANTLLPQSAPSGALRCIFESADCSVKIYHINELKSAQFNEASLANQILEIEPNISMFQTSHLRLQRKSKKKNSACYIIPQKVEWFKILKEKSSFKSIRNIFDIL
jgi:hypothetical protein